MSVIKSASISITNQVLSSGFNFFILIHLARGMSSNEYGLFVICYSAIFALSGVSVSLISAPMALRLRPNEPSKARDFVSKSLYLCCIGYLALAIIAIILISTTGVIQTFKTEVFGVFLSSLFYGLKDVLVKLTYALKHETHFLYSNLLTGVAVVPSFLTLETLGHSISTEQSLLLYSVGQAVGFVYLLKSTHVSLKPHSMKCLKAYFLEFFHHGKWSLLSSVLYTTRTQAHNFIASPFLGLSGVARINAARNLVMPVMLLPPPFGQILIARLVCLAPDSRASLRLIHSTIIFLLSISLLYFVLLSLGYKHITANTGNYQNIQYLVALWALISCILAVKTILDATLEARGFFRELFTINMYGALVAIPFSLVLSQIYAEIGAITALLLTECVLCALTANLYVKILNKQGI